MFKQKKCFKILSFALFLTTTNIAFSAENNSQNYLEPKISKLTIFDEGIVAVQRILENPFVQKYAISDNFTPLNGSINFVPFGSFIVKKEKVKTKAPIYGTFKDINSTFLNKKVIIQSLVGEEDIQNFSGTVIQPFKTANNDIIILQDDKNPNNIRFIKTKDIVAIKSLNGINNEYETAKNIVSFTPTKLATNKVYMNYLSHGFYWDSNYKFILCDDKNLEIEHSAVICNNFSDIENIEVQLASGTPQIFNQVAGFFAIDNQNLVKYDDDECEDSFGEAPATFVKNNFVKKVNSNTDLKFQNIGKITLKKGENLRLPLNKKNIKYDKIVQWDLDNTRNSYGAVQRKSFETPCYNAIKFINPYDYPLNKGLVQFYQNNKFIGQGHNNWVNPQQETILTVNHAKSVIVNYFENSSTKGDVSFMSKINKNNSKQQVINNNRYRKEINDAKLIIKNFRKEAVEMVISLKITGNVLEANIKPQETTLNNLTTVVNDSRLLTWEITIPAQETKEITLSYELFRR